jgi:hypothetical protein
MAAGVLALLLASLATVLAAPNLANSIVLSDLSSGARCLDGTMPRFVWHRGPTHCRFIPCFPPFLFFSGTGCRFDHTHMQRDTQRKMKNEKKERTVKDNLFFVPTAARHGRQQLQMVGSVTSSHPKTWFH